MTIRRLFSIASILLLMVGLAWFLFPGYMLSLWGLIPNDALVYMTRRYTVCLLGFALLLWLARKTYQSAARQAIVWYVFALSTFMAILSLFGVLSDTISALGWIPFIVEMLLALGCGYFLFIKPEPTEQIDTGV